MAIAPQIDIIISQTKPLPPKKPDISKGWYFCAATLGAILPFAGFWLLAVLFAVQWDRDMVNKENGHV